GRAAAADRAAHQTGTDGVRHGTARGVPANRPGLRAVPGRVGGAPPGGDLDDLVRGAESSADHADRDAGRRRTAGVRPGAAGTGLDGRGTGPDRVAAGAGATGVPGT